MTSAVDRRTALGVYLALAVFVGFSLVDFIQRVAGSDPVAVAFPDGGDDAYYYFTVARNVANGLGITIDGVHWTSGFQPLWLLPGVVAFLTHSDRLALAFVYIVSVALWLTGAMLFVAFVRRAVRPLGPLETALVAAVFLCEHQLNTLYINGMESGLYCSLVLLLLLAFQDYFRSMAQAFEGRQAMRLGLLSGLLLLARNDGVFLCGFLGLLAVFASGRRHRLREMLVGGAVAACLVVPWLAYCQWAAGVPMPQSGVATSAAVRHVSMPEVALDNFVSSLVPMLFSRVQQTVDEHLVVASIAASVIVLGLIGVAMRPRASIFDRSSRLVLWALIASTLVLLAYYPVFSAAVQFYGRYFVPAKLVMLILGTALVLRMVERARRRFVVGTMAVLLAALAVLSNLYWVSLRLGRTWDGYLGWEAYNLPRSPYMAGATRIGMLESGRMGFLYPQRIVNLDGKMNTDALRAIRAGRLGEYINRQDFDLVMLHAFDVEWLDRSFAVWRQHYADAGTFGNLFLFRRKAGP